MVRACVIPDNEYNNLDPNAIPYCDKHFYELYEKLFGVRNCSYNTHTVGSHMPEIRTHGPLTLTSAFGFESFYGELRHSFVPGTISPMKQALQKVMLKREIAPHCCKSPIFFSTKESAMECNSYIYTYIENAYQLYKIQSIDNTDFECCKVGKFPTIFPETPTLNWEKVGVFQAGGISEDTVIIRKEDIAGKVVKVDEFFITCSNNVLEEK